MSWTGSDEIRAQLERRWERGEILGARLRREALFPLRLRTTRPTSRELGERFEEVRSWIRALEQGSRATRGAGWPTGSSGWTCTSTVRKRSRT